MDAQRPEAVTEIERLRAQKDGAYAERNQCAAALARMAILLGWRAGVRRHEGEDWEDDWRTVLCVDLPTGQVTWHLHDSERHLVEGLPQYPDAWDGHDTATKYERVRGI